MGGGGRVSVVQRVRGPDESAKQQSTLLQWPRLEESPNKAKLDRQQGTVFVRWFELKYLDISKERN